MLKRRWIHHTWPALLGLALTAGASTEYVAAQISPAATKAEDIAKPVRQASHLETYHAPDGSNYFALSLMPQQAIPAAEARDVVILFDTSASQSGVYRDKALAALRDLTATLGEKDRVALYSVDVNAVPMTTALVSPKSPEFAAALGKLQQRAPLGSTDMGEALNAAAEVLAGGNAPKRVVYIGDGQNSAGLGGEDLHKTLDKLIDQRVSVSSYAVGPDSNNAFLASVSNLTGGALVIDSETITAQQAAQIMQGIVTETVLWPTEVKLPKGIAKLYPGKLPPLRTDRDTIVIGEGKLDQPFEVAVTADSSGKPVELKWSVAPNKSSDDNAYLAQLTKVSAQDNGYGLPTLGTEGLKEARFMVNQGAHDLLKLSRQAISSGRKDQAKLLVKESLRRDPGNPEAQALDNAIEKGGVIPVSAQLPGAVGVPSNDLRLVRQPEVLPDFAPGLLGNVEQRIDLIEQKLRGEVLQGMNNARGLLGSDPIRAELELKQLLERVEATPDLRATARSELRETLTRAIREAQTRVVDFDANRLEILQRTQAAQERKQALDMVLTQQARVKQLMERFNALLAEGRYRDAELRAALQAYQIEQIPTTSNAVRYAFLRGAYADYERTRYEKRRALVESYMSIERSSIPTSDDPPISYPEADFWRDITARREKYKSVDLRETGSAEALINKRLDEEISFNLNQNKLEDIVEQIRTEKRIEVQLDRMALEEAAFDTATPIDKVILNTKLRSALRLVLNDLGLSYVIENDVLLITTKTAQENKQVVKVYPVADLVVPITNGGGINPFALGGGFGGGGPGAFGGGGGNGQGQGINGFGGAGAGGGGFGGGGGGGGFFNVPDPIVLPQAGDAGLQAMAVPDNLTLKKAPAPQQLAPAPQPAPQRGVDLVEEENLVAKQMQHKPTRINLDVPANGDYDAAWDKHFEGRVKLVAGEKDSIRMMAAFRQDADIRETTRLLMNEQQYKQVAAMIRAALRNGYSQPWMYETLGLAMIADDQPLVEIERALMSAVDYAKTPNDILMVAIYMSRTEGLKPRALKLLKLVSQRAPDLAEPYQLALHLGEQTGNLDAIEWSSLGILSKACTREQKSLEGEAKRLALSTLETLKKQGQDKDVFRFEKALQKALQRDLVVRVTWTGDADIDLMVEEPTGTVCSMSTPRTISGGVLTGNTGTVKQARNGLGSFSEEYVVPEGFAGTYRVMLKRIWGQVTAGKVHVEVITNQGTEHAVVKSETIPLGEKPALVILELKEGRRLEKLDEAQIQVAAADQIKVGQMILAQQLAALPGTAGSSGAANVPGNGSNNIPNNLFPFFNRGAVGYMPVITTLPEGANMSAQAVVSADRRYVRITATPLFSTIPEVSTFNFATGGGSTMDLGGDVGGPQVGGGGVPPQ